MDWCRTCCTKHAPGEPCPGELSPTGPERTAYRATVEARGSIEAYGVLLAPAGAFWRARIITFPNVLWTLPGGTTTLKFAGAGAADAERQAVAFIHEHCRLRGYAIRAPREFTGAVPGVLGKQACAPVPALRKVRNLLVRFGPRRALQRGFTANLSTTGLFVATSRPLKPVSSVILNVDLDGRWEGLAGTVRWNRLRPEPGRALGMGIGLRRPSSAYEEFVRRLG